ncbi:protein O-mannosyl-transferase TMTC1-like [Haemaphysalis longicornis]
MACGSCIGAGTDPALQTTIGWVPRHAALRTAPKGLVELDADSRNSGPVAEIIALGDSVVRVVTDFAGVACSVFAACIRFCRGRAVVTVADDASKGSTGRLQEQQVPERGRHAEDHRNKRRGMASSARESARFVDTRSRMCCDGVVARWPAVCAGVVAVLCYLNSLDGEFVHDDMVAVVGNPDVTGEHHRPRTQRAPSSLWMNDFWGRPMSDPQSHKSYRPLTVLSFRANFLASGLQVRGYHVINVALHCACSALVATVAQSDVRMQSLPAGLAATLFAAHPLHTEAVSSIVGRAELLCCLFFLLSFVCYQR